MKNLSNLLEIEKDFVLSFLLYTMDQDQRGKLMQALPAQYAKIFGMDLDHVARLAMERAAGIVRTTVLK